MAKPVSPGGVTIYKLHLQRSGESDAARYLDPIIITNLLYSASLYNHQSLTHDVVLRDVVGSIEKMRA